MDTIQQAIEACSCPRAGEESLATPLCAADGFVEGNNSSVLFVASPAGLACDQLNSYGGKRFCSCQKRLRVYQAYRI